MMVRADPFAIHSFQGVSSCTAIVALGMVWPPRLQVCMRIDDVSRRWSYRSLLILRICNHRQGVSRAGPSDTPDLERRAEGDKARHTASHQFQEGTSIDSRIIHLRMWVQRWITPWHLGLGFRQADLKTSSCPIGLKRLKEPREERLFFATLFSKLARRLNRRGRNDPWPIGQRVAGNSPQCAEPVPSSSLTPGRRRRRPSRSRTRRGETE
jgi:hypothetical protein